MLFICSAHSHFAFLFAVQAIIHNYEGACNCKALLLVKHNQAAVCNLHWLCYVYISAYTKPFVTNCVYYRNFDSLLFVVMQ